MKVQLSLGKEILCLAALYLGLAVLIGTGQAGTNNFAGLLRLILGFVDLLLLPGYLIHLIFFPRAEDIDLPERFALSFGLSIALIPILALILNYLPGQLSFNNVVISESAVILSSGVIAFLRRVRIPQNERFYWIFNFALKGWWVRQNRTTRLLWGLLAFSLLLAIGAGLLSLASHTADSFFTEFYLLGDQGLAEDYPRNATVGVPITVNFGVTNRENETSHYTIEVSDQAQIIGKDSPFDLPIGRSYQGSISFTPTQAGASTPILFYLYRGDTIKPYRTLRLWLNVTDLSQSGTTDN